MDEAIQLVSKLLGTKGTGDHGKKTFELMDDLSSTFETTLQECQKRQSAGEKFAAPTKNNPSNKASIDTKQRKQPPVHATEEKDCIDTTDDSAAADEAIQDHDDLQENNEPRPTEPDALTGQAALDPLPHPSAEVELTIAREIDASRESLDHVEVDENSEAIEPPANEPIDTDNPPDATETSVETPHPLQQAELSAAPLPETERNENQDVEREDTNVPQTSKKSVQTASPINEVDEVDTKEATLATETDTEVELNAEDELQDSRAYTEQASIERDESDEKEPLPVASPAAPAIEVTKMAEVEDEAISATPRTQQQQRSLSIAPSTVVDVDDSESTETDKLRSDSKAEPQILDQPIQEFDAVTETQELEAPEDFHSIGQSTHEVVVDLTSEETAQILQDLQNIAYATQVQEVSPEQFSSKLTEGLRSSQSPYLNLLDTTSGSNESNQGSPSQLQAPSSELPEVQSKAKAEAPQTPFGKLQTKIIQQVRLQMRIGIKGKIGEIRLQLEPKFLGKVRVKLAFENNQGKAQFVVENQTVKELLQRSLPTLQQALADQGIDVGSVEVDLASDQSGDFGNGRAFASQEDQEAVRTWLSSFNTVDRLKAIEEEVEPSQDVGASESLDVLV